MANSVYDFSVKDNQGKEVALDKYRGKVLLIVNTASRCGFTPQYEGLEQLQQELAPEGFSVLAFPCNQFGGQEPGSDEEIAKFCELNYQTSFPLFQKVDVNGDQAAPLFNYLKEAAPGFMGSKAIKWNFTKFLVDKEGKPFQRFASKDKPESLRASIEDLL